jgi:hypothetical protein
VRHDAADGCGDRDGRRKLRQGEDAAAHADETPVPDRLLESPTPGEGHDLGCTSLPPGQTHDLDGIALHRAILSALNAPAGPPPRSVDNRTTDELLGDPR